MNQLYIFSTIIVLFLGLIIYYFYRSISKIHRETPLDKEKLSSYEKTFSGIELALSDDSQFLRYSQYIKLKDDLENLKNQLSQLKNVFLRKKKSELLDKLDMIAADLPNLREQTNKRFMELERQEPNAFLKIQMLERF
jgi:hypothetical protein